MIVAVVGIYLFALMHVHPAGIELYTSFHPASSKIYVNVATSLKMYIQRVSIKVPQFNEKY